MNQQLAPSRVGALDGIRGVAIISVMGVHFFQDEGPIGLAIGVDIFFVLSGFLITKLMLKADDRDPHFDQAYFRNFYRRRFTRLMPALFGVTGVYLLLGPLLIDFPLKRVAAEVIASLTFTYPFLAAVGVDNGLGLLPMWSLSVEIWFYVIWPPVLGYLLRHSLPRRRIAIGLALSAVAVQLLRALTYASGTMLLHRIRIDLFAIGAVFALIPTASSIANAKVRAAAGFALPLLAITALLSRPFPYAVDAGVTFLPEEVARFFGPWGGPGFAVSMWCCGAMVLCVAERRSTWYSQFLSTRALVFVGTISYSVYLWHYPISIAIYRRGPSILRWNSGDTVNWMGLVLYTIVCAVVSIGVGWISYQLLERRVIRSRASAT